MTATNLFISNTVTSASSALLIASGTATALLENVVFTDASAYVSPGVDISGVNSVTMTNVTLSNISGGQAALLTVQGPLGCTLTLTGVQVLNAQVSSVLSVTLGSLVSVTNSTIAQVTSSQSTMYVNGAVLNMDNVNMNSLVSAGSGGAMTIGSSAFVTITDCSFQNCTAQLSGGAIAFQTVRVALFQF